MKLAALAAALTLALGLGAFAPAASAKPFPWPHGAKAAVVLTYDDALVSQLDNAAPQLDAAGLKGTFFLNQTFAAKDLPRWKALAKHGHELANHTVFHPCYRGTFEMPPQRNLENYSVSWMLGEISAMNTFLGALDGQSRHTFATPCGQTKAGGEDYIEPLRKSGLVTATRTASSGSSDAWGLDPFAVPGIFFPETATGADLIKAVTDTEATGGLFVFGFHGVGGDYLQTTSAAHKELVAWLAAHRRDVWVTTFREATDYVAKVKAGK